MTNYKMSSKQEWVFCYWDEPLILKPKISKDEKNKDCTSWKKRTSND